MRLRSFLPFVLLNVVGACTAAVEEESLETTEAALPSEHEAEMTEAFNDAVLYCDRYLLEPVRTARVNDQPVFKEVPPLCGSGATQCEDDLRLKTYAQNPPTALSLNSPHGAGAPITRQLNTQPLVDQERKSNGCADAVTAFGSAPVDATMAPAPGLCRADFNYCIAQQLRQKADSLARPPSSRGVREALLHEARTRFALSASEHARTLAWIDDHRDATCQIYADVWDWDGQRRTAPKTHVFRYEVAHESCPSDECACPRGGGWNCTICQIWLKNCQAAGATQAAQTCAAHDAQDRTALRGFVAGDTAQHGTPNCSTDASYPANRYPQPAIRTQVRNSVQMGTTTPSGGAFSRTVTCAISETHADGYVSRCASNAYERDKLRLASGYAALALERINDALAQVQSTAEAEVQDLLGDSEAIALYDTTRPGSYGDAVWGASSARMKAAHLLVGSSEPPSDVHTFAQWPVPNDAARIALNLILDHRAPLPYTATVVRGNGGEAIGVSNVSWPVPSDAALNSTAANVLSLLAARLAEAAHKPVAEGQAMLTQDYRVDQVAIAAALRLLDNQLRTLDVDFLFTLPNVEVANDATQVQPAIELRTRMTLQKHMLPLASALTLADAAAEVRGTRAYFEAAGLAGMAHEVRTELMQLATRTGLRSWATEDRLNNALAFTNKLAGDGWVLAQYTPSTRQQALRFVLAQSTPARQYSFGSDPDVMACLHLGHRAGQNGGCAGLLTPMAAPVVGTSMGLRYEDVAFTVPSDTNGAKRYYIVASTCGDQGCKDELVAVVPAPKTEGQVGGSDPCAAVRCLRGYHCEAVQTQCTTSSCEIVGKCMPNQLSTAARSIFVPNTQRVFALGGRTMELLGQVLAKSPSDPAYAQINALGINTRFVPAFRTLDVPNGDVTEFHMRRLVRAETAVGLAKDQVEYARSLEEAYIQTHTQTVQASERAREGARVEVENACSGQNEPGMPACDVKRRPEMTLAQLGLLQVPDTVPETHDHQSCANYTLALSLPETGDANTLENTLGDALVCSHWRVKQLAADTLVHDVPEGVIAALQTRVGRGEAGPSFSNYGGELQEQLLAFYQALVEVRYGFEDFESGYAIAKDSLQAAVDNVEDLDQSEWKKWQCRIGLTLNALNSLAKAVLAAETGGTLPSVNDRGQGDVGHAETGNLAFDTVTTVAAIGRCEDPNEDQQIDLARDAYFSVARAIDSMRLGTRAAERVGTLTALADNRLDAIARGVRQAEERIDFEQRIAALDPVLASPIWRRMRGESATRAAINLLTAQRRLYEARRAIEYRTASDLSSVTTLVDSHIPVAWSRKLYAPPTFQPELALKDYAQSLRGFVEGYADAYNFSEVYEYAESLSLAAVLANEVDESVAQSVPFADRLWFKCHDQSELLLGGVVPGTQGAPCAALGGVDYATVTFTVPPGLGAYLRSMLPSSRVNVVHQLFVLNFRGTQLRDCEEAANRNACYTSYTLPYWLYQHPEAVLENLDHELHAFDLRPAVLADVPGLANELTLTDTAAQQLIAQTPTLRRTELSGRPLIGQYTVRIDGRPEIVWENLEDLELQLSYSAWSPQGIALLR